MFSKKILPVLFGSYELTYTEAGTCLLVVGQHPNDVYCTGYDRVLDESVGNLGNYSFGEKLEESGVEVCGFYWSTFRQIAIKLPFNAQKMKIEIKGSKYKGDIWYSSSEANGYNLELEEGEAVTLEVGETVELKIYEGS